MTARNEPTDPGPRPTAEQLRQRIDSGATGDKVAFPDPAAVPLGADEEAAGTPLSREALARAHADEVRPAAAERPRTSGRWLGVALIVAGATLLIWLMLGG
jgi:hypothetical protein